MSTSDSTPRTRVAIPCALHNRYHCPEGCEQLFAQEPQRYAVTATIQFRGEDGWDCTRQVPTFYLDANVQGIVSEEHARRIAEDILTAAVPDRTAVRCFITAVAL